MNWILVFFLLLSGASYGALALVGGGMSSGGSSRRIRAGGGGGGEQRQQQLLSAQSGHLARIRRVAAPNLAIAESAADVPLPLPELRHSDLPGETLYLLDGTSMLFRAYFGPGQEPYSSGDGTTDVGAVKAMAFELARFLIEVNPRYLAVSFDVNRDTTWRRELFPEYKAQRKPHPLGLDLQIPLAKAMASALGCQVFFKEGYEADDVMATLSKWGRGIGLNVVVLSEDKDMCQLVAERVHVMHPRRKNYAILGMEEVEAKFGLPSHRVPELLGLIGDSADNIPGVAGIGPKKGQYLLQHFPSVDTMFDRVDEVKDLVFRGAKSAHAKLSEPTAREDVKLYVHLATLVDDVPSILEGPNGKPLKSADCLYRGVDRYTADKVFRVLGFTGPLRMVQEDRQRRREGVSRSE